MPKVIPENRGVLVRIDAHALRKNAIGANRAPRRRGNAASSETKL
jgi:hypothetical protein